MSEPEEGGRRQKRSARPRGFATCAVHGPPDSNEQGTPFSGAAAGSRPHAPPIYQTSAFAFEDVDAAVAAFRGSGAWIYTRKGNPTIRALERHVAALEVHPLPGRAPVAGSELSEDAGPGHSSMQNDSSTSTDMFDARAFASGMAAITALFIAAATGRRAVCQDGIYGTTVAAAERLSRLGIDVDFVPAGNLDALRGAVEAGPPPALVYIETPANPLLQLTDVQAAAEIAHGAGASLAVDATFATPALLRPLAWGADFAVHSTTKFMSGHGVALGGVVTGPADRLKRELDPVRRDLGGVADPFASWLTLLGLRTLDVRMVRQSENARALGESLADHPAVVRVLRPDPGSLPAGQLLAPGPMLSVEVEGDAERALRVIESLRLATLVPTLGTLDTLVQHPYTMSHAVLPADRRERLGIRAGVIRISVGLEDADDLIDDFWKALDA